LINANSCQHHLVFRFPGPFTADFNEAEDENPKERAVTSRRSRQKWRPIDYAEYFNDKGEIEWTLAALRAREYIGVKPARVYEKVEFKEDLLLPTSSPWKVSPF
jgi:hypothetical protein